MGISCHGSFLGSSVLMSLILRIPATELDIWWPHGSKFRGINYPTTLSWKLPKKTTVTHDILASGIILNKTTNHPNTIPKGSPEELPSRHFVYHPKKLTAISPFHWFTKSNLTLLGRNCPHEMGESRPWRVIKMGTRGRGARIYDIYK